MKKICLCIFIVIALKNLYSENNNSMILPNNAIIINTYTDTTRKIEAPFVYRKIGNKLIAAKVMIGTGIACYVAGAVNILIGFGLMLYGSRFDFTPHLFAFGAGFISGTPLIISGIAVKAQNMGKLRRHYSANTSYIKVNIGSTQIGLVYKF